MEEGEKYDSLHPLVNLFVFQLYPNMIFWKPPALSNNRIGGSTCGRQKSKPFL
jgi:hypothetical protein